MSDFEIRGSEQFEQVAKALNATGDKQLKKDMAKGLRTVTKPLIASVRRVALRDLPSRGGLAARVAASKIGTRNALSGKNVGVRIAGRSGYDLKSIDEGTLRHPVFGNKNVYVEQDIDGGFWSETLQDGAPKVRREIENVLDETARRIANG